MSAPETRPSRLRSRSPWFGVALLVLVADLVTKTAVFYPHCVAPGFREGMAVGRVASWWQTVLAYNRGVTFGLGGNLGTGVVATLTSAVIAVLAWKLWTTPDGDRLRSVALSMIVGGATGNLYDRALRPHVEADRRPGVRDFLDWHVPDHWRLAEWLRDHGITTHWYTSNVADVLIVSGVILLAWRILTEKPEERATP